MDTQRRTLDDWLDDLCVRFIVNLPESELQGFDRIGTHVEEAHWFYEDFIRPLDPSLPSMSLRNFSLRIFQHCPLTAHCGPDILEKAYAHWIGYKKRIPVRGAILLNEALDSVLLVRGYYKSAAWMFPRGKINEGEDDLDCAIREVYEEIGFHVKDAGLIPENRELRSFEMTIRDQHVKLFVIPNVPMNAHFEPRTRKEIGAIQWYRLADLPGRPKKKQGQDITGGSIPSANKFYMVASFLEQLNKWIKQQLKRREKTKNVHKNGPIMLPEVDDVMTEEEGMATETGLEPPPVFATVESHEAATKELHKLLKIQPPTQRSQAGVPGQGQDEGQALLAMLQQKKDVPLQLHSIGQPNYHIPHTPMDRVSKVAPEPRTPPDHQPPSRLRYDHHLAPPPLMVQPDMNSELRSVLGVAGNPMAQSSQQHNQQNDQAMYQQPSVRTMPSDSNRPTLIHPQPLPRQANHILAGAKVPTPPTASVGPHQISQSGSMPNFVSGMALPQLLATNRQQPGTLDNTRLALLNAFKKDTAPAREQSFQGAPDQRSMTENHRPSQQQPPNLASLASAYTVQIAAGLSSQDSAASLSGLTMENPHSVAIQTGLRAPNVSETQQKALLDIFKQPSTLFPRQQGAQSDMKGNGTTPFPGLSNQPSLQQQYPDSNAGSVTRGTSIANIPFEAQSLAMRPKSGDQRGLQQQQTVHPVSHMLSGLSVDGASAENRAATLFNTGRAIQHAHNNGIPYGSSSQAVLQGAPATQPPFTDLMPRRQEADPQQLQKLMSLFSDPAKGTPSSSLASTGVVKGKEPMLYNAGQNSLSGSHSASLAAPPQREALGSTPSMSRRSSQQQAPISPENEKFLLNYLKTVSSSAK